MKERTGELLIHNMYFSFHSPSGEFVHDSIVAERSSKNLPRTVHFVLTLETLGTCKEEIAINLLAQKEQNGNCSVRAFELY
jgi:hypothetical protein